MKIAYYPGCTLKTKALNLENSALATMAALGVDVEELPRWNCCGALFSLADDDLIHQVAPVRNLVRAKEHGKDGIVTLCAQCYNTLARANLLMREDQEKRDTLNRFMDEEPDYSGEVEVIHYLTLLKEQIGWDALKKESESAAQRPEYSAVLRLYSRSAGRRRSERAWKQYSAGVHRSVGSNPRWTFRLLRNAAALIRAWPIQRKARSALPKCLRPRAEPEPMPWC